MGFDITGLGSAFDFGSKIIDKLFPDKAEADKQKLALLTLQQNGEFKELEERMKAITTEGSSADPLTSRARPSFLYVMYVLLLSSIPFGLTYAINPIAANNFVTGFKSWFDAIPGDLYALFGAGYLGYGAYRSYDKRKS